MQARIFIKSSFDPCLYRRKNQFGEVYYLCDSLCR
jgi:hypothetical protein